MSDKVYYHRDLKEPSKVGWGKPPKEDNEISLDVPEQTKGDWKSKKLIVETADQKYYTLHPMIWHNFGLFNNFMELNENEQYFQVFFTSKYMEEIIDMFTVSDGRGLYERRYKKIADYLLLSEEIGLDNIVEDAFNKHTESRSNYLQDTVASYIDIFTERIKSISNQREYFEIERKISTEAGSKFIGKKTKTIFCHLSNREYERDKKKYYKCEYYFIITEFKLQSFTVDIIYNIFDVTKT